MGIPNKIWLTINELTTDGVPGEIPTSNGASQAAAIDFLAVLDPSNIAQWADVSAATSTIKIYAWDAFNLTQSQLSAIGAFATSKGYKLVMEAGVLRPGAWTSDGSFVERTTPPPAGDFSSGWGLEGFNGAMARAYENLRNAGVTLDYVAMDEGFAAASSINWTPLQTATRPIAD